MIPKDAVEFAAAEIYHTSGRSRVMPYSQARKDCEAEALRILVAAAPFIRAQALENAADQLVWVRPEKSPCGAVEACCGSEDSCDAMNRSTSVVGEHWLRARAATERGQA